MRSGLSSVGVQRRLSSVAEFLWRLVVGGGEDSRKRPVLSLVFLFSGVKPGKFSEELRSSGCPGLRSSSAYSLDAANNGDGAYVTLWVA
jgi:hypothetical protein